MKLTFYITITVFLIFTLFVVFVSSLKSTVFNFDYEKRYNISLSFPQGWGYFTRNPREDQYYLYNENYKRVDIKNTASENYYGFSRKSRRINLEFQRLLYNVPKESWSSEMPFTEIFIENPIGEYYYLIDKIYIIKRKSVIPWMYSRYKGQYVPEEYFVKINNCNN